MSIMGQRGGRLAELLPLLAVALLAAGAGTARSGGVPQVLVQLLGRREVNVLMDELRGLLAAELRSQLQSGLEELRARL